ncbi:M3 family metallopeptidase [Sulfurimonas sp. MAG313]|nr:M3 family metallopeptidase [Sulfurimonas sp. MAG313]MDF1879909.1 M3 family metallopeptidase [Sulfurimonas sp. MAG313]
MFLDFDVNLDTAISELSALLEKSKKEIETLLQIKNKNYANFVKPFEMIDERLEWFFTPISHLNSVNNSEQTQEVYASALPILTEYGTEISQNEDIYKVFKEIKNKEGSSLNQEQNQVLEHNIRDFELSGAHLSQSKKDRLKEINLLKSTLTNDFSQNLLDATNAYELIIKDKKDVEGLPSSDIEAAKQEDGSYKFTLQMPSYIAYMTYAKNPQLREELYKAYTTRAPENAEIIDKLMQLRQEMSWLLDFDNFSELSIAPKMATSTDTVINFLEELAKASQSQAKTELKELQTLAKKEGQDSISSFDTAYYSEILKKEKYEIDEEAYRPYFEQNSVVQGLFSFLNKLLGIEFKAVDVKLWDDKASAYDLYFEGKLRSRLYIDLEARTSKRGGAWMDSWQSHCKDEEGKTILSSAYIVCNFPASSEKSPSLLRHDDVVTLFHEMGHALHHMMSDVNENSVSGVNGVEWDAVEFPSQFLENFAYEPEVLRLFASHHESGEVIPDEMIIKLDKARNFQSAMGMLRQIEFSLFDFRLHMKLHTGDEIQGLLDSIRDEFSLLKPPSYNKFQNGFAHIFSGGYAAGYYSYKWAEVLSADAFYHFVDNGIFNEKISAAYRDIVLGRGGSESMSVLFEKFMGRELDTTGLLRLNGITA